jgi:hypothetical protein
MPSPTTYSVKDGRWSPFLEHPLDRLLVVLTVWAVQADQVFSNAAPMRFSDDLSGLDWLCRKRPGRQKRSVLSVAATERSFGPTWRHIKRQATGLLAAAVTSGSGLPPQPTTTPMRAMQVSIDLPSANA